MIRCLPSPPVFPLAVGCAVLTVVWVAWASTRDPEPLWAPGDVSRYHRQVARCMDCHEPFHGPLGSKCIACHSANQFTAHSTPPVRSVHLEAVHRGNVCLGCHTEHRGAFASVTVGVLDNPHSDFVFKATGTHSCADCHAVPVTTTGRPALLNNAAVRHLMKEGEGAHRPGTFARCLRCHIDGKVDLDDEH